MALEVRGQAATEVRAVTVAALYVAKGGVYYGLPDVVPYGLPDRDAREYRGPWSVVAHPDCARWGRYWSGGPNPNARRRELGDDDGQFWAALHAVVEYGGVLEHPEASHAWLKWNISRPPKSGGWIPAGSIGGWTCCVEQGHYGHPARKATWLYCRGVARPPELIWGPSNGSRLDEGFHSQEERVAARAAGVPPRKRLSRAENIATPIAFRDDVMLAIARSARGAREAA